MPVPLIIDTDPGVDDAFAIALAALHPDVELLAVTTVYGNVPLATTTPNAGRVLALCGRADVPVAAGADRPLVYPYRHRTGTVHGVDGLSGIAGTLPDPAPVHAESALELTARLLAEAREPVTIAAIGPLTNIALLLAGFPKLRNKIGRLVIMGGGLNRGNSTAAAEFNVHCDPEAARRVLVGGSVPTTLVPLDLTYRCAVSDVDLAELAAASPIGAALVGLTGSYRTHYRDVLGWNGIVLHDAVAVAEAISQGLLRTEEFPLDVDCTHGPSRGATIVDQRRVSHRRSAIRDTADHIDNTVDELDNLVDVATEADLTEVRQFIWHTIGAK